MRLNLFVGENAMLRRATNVLALRNNFLHLLLTNLLDAFDCSEVVIQSHMLPHRALQLIKAQLT